MDGIEGKEIENYEEPNYSINQPERIASEQPGTGCIVGADPKMIEVFRTINLLAERRDVPILIRGDTGTGKDLVAQALHYNAKDDDRHSRPYGIVNCSAIPSELLEATLFGHEEGAYTGAHRSRTGIVRHSHKGTLFLDEIGDMSSNLQAKILRMIETGEIRRVGSDVLDHVDVRIISATNKNLENMMKKGEFREDLYHRLNVMSIELPTLAERPGDIPLITSYLLGLEAQYFDGKELEVSAEASQMLQSNPWPGNIRELKNVLKRATILSNGETILPEHLRLNPGPEQVDYK
ncbi:sigma 54-interacting transcriptional regulator [Nanoarchaeota archaeon]